MYIKKKRQVDLAVFVVGCKPESNMETMQKQEMGGEGQR